MNPLEWGSEELHFVRDDVVTQPKLVSSRLQIQKGTRYSNLHRHETCNKSKVKLPFFSIASMTFVTNNGIVDPSRSHKPMRWQSNTRRSRNEIDNTNNIVKISSNINKDGNRLVNMLNHFLRLVAHGSSLFSVSIVSSG